MMSKDVRMEKSRSCSACGKRMHHGYLAISMHNQKGKIKGYACSDTCAKTFVSKQQAPGPGPAQWK